MNSVALSGRIATEPDLRQTVDEKSVCSFRLAVERPNSDKTDFINCVAWHDVAELVGKNYRKGQWIEFNGFIQVSEVKYSADKKSYTTEVRCEYVPSRRFRNETYSSNIKTENSAVAFSSQFTVDECDMPV